MSIPKCRECEYCKNIGVRKRFWVGFKCSHPKAPQRDAIKGGGDPAFIGQSERREKHIKIKTSPRWCPLRRSEEYCSRAERNQDGTCRGYQKSEMDDEPAEMCKGCSLSELFEEEDDVSC